MSMEGVGRVQTPQNHGREFWVLALELQRESGLTPAAFCRREGISNKAFWRWKRKLSQSRQPADAPVAFLPVTVTDGRPVRSSQAAVTGCHGALQNFGSASMRTHSARYSPKDYL